jgi:hypothetical protein
MFPWIFLMPLMTTVTSLRQSLSTTTDETAVSLLQLLMATGALQLAEAANLVNGKD